MNRNGNDGRITRFGWKAQNPSGLVFSGEAYNVEMGITNEAFQTERDETPECQFAQPAKRCNERGWRHGHRDGASAIEKFAFFMRFLDQPIRLGHRAGRRELHHSRGATPSYNIGCALVPHTCRCPQAMRRWLLLRNKTANLYSDLALHNMGPGLADDVRARRGARR